MPRDAKSISIPEGPEWKRRCLSTGVPKPSDFARRGAQPHSIHTKVHRHGTMLAEFVLHYRSDMGLLHEGVLVHKADARAPWRCPEAASAAARDRRGAGEGGGEGGG
eukprot:CAMPEP_0173115010 /NCGR_PEP_ID=MMETSP1102-20130122/48078_1 /TAXON_ID=49646 /ORGANISM="Geminigera sp., Strain Caron Lab Isolate" /LENGTH=106 /DNA_ID=CAMNT_0014017629 /DNA_START=17 /DNA_END=333 /DNA_ORIENTATION=-